MLLNILKQHVAGEVLKNLLSAHVINVQSVTQK